MTEPVSEAVEMRRQLDEARETNRRLNRVNQKLQSDIANDRHIVATYTEPMPPSATGAERQQWSFRRDSAMLHFRQRWLDCQARAEEAEARIAQAVADEREACIRVAKRALFDEPWLLSVVESAIRSRSKETQS